MPYMPAIGAICTARGIIGQWRVVSHTHDGIVNKCVLKSLETGQIATKFNFEVTELPTSNYSDVNQFLKEVAGLSSEDIDAVFTEAFECDDVLDATLMNQNLNTEPVMSSSFKAETDESTNPQPSKRFKAASVEDIHKLKLQNTEKSTDRQTKWAVKLLKGMFKHVYMFCGPLQVLTCNRGNPWYQII